MTYNQFYIASLYNSGHLVISRKFRCRGFHNSGHSLVPRGYSLFKSFTVGILIIPTSFVNSKQNKY